MKKYKVYKNVIFLESYAKRYEAENAIRTHKHQERMQSHINMECVEVNVYDIRR